MGNQDYRKNIEQKLLARGRVVTDWWDGQPVHRAMTPYERFSKKQKEMGARVPTEAEASTWLFLLGNRNYKPRFRI